MTPCRTIMVCHTLILYDTAIPYDPIIPYHTVVLKCSLIYSISEDEVLYQAGLDVNSG